MLDGDRVDVEDARVPARLDLTVLLNCAEDFPSVSPVLLVARQPVREEQRLDRLGPQDVPRVIHRRRPRSTPHKRTQNTVSIRYLERDTRDREKRGLTSRP